MKNQPIQLHIPLTQANSLHQSYRGAILATLEAYSSHLTIRHAEMVGIKVIHALGQKNTSAKRLKVYEARIQLPFWLASRTWDVNIRQACSGWRIFLRPRIVRPFSADILHIIKKGSSVELFRKLIKCSRSIHDCDETGNTLLHVSVSLYIRMDRG